MDLTYFNTSLEEINSLYLKAIDKITIGNTSNAEVREFYTKMHSLKGSAGLLGFSAHGKVAHGLESILKDAIANSIASDEEVVRFIDSGMELLNTTSLASETAERFYNDVVQYKSIYSTELNPEQEKSYFLNMPEELYNVLPPEDRTKILSYFRQGKNIYILYAFFATENIPALFNNLKSLEKNGLLPISTFPIMPDNGKIGVGRIFISEAGNTFNLKAQFSELWANGSWFGIDAPVVESKKKALVNLRLPLSRYESLFSKVSDLYFNFDKISEKNELFERIRDIFVSSKEIGAVPIKPVFAQLNIYGKNKAMNSGKMVKFVFSGGQTDVPYRLHNTIKDILIQLINNNLAHGITAPEEREKAGKNREGRVEIIVKREETSIAINVSDDGDGVDISEISKNFSIKNRKDLWEVISAPGITTTAEVSDISGRGSGLAYVREVVENLNGDIVIDNSPGKGLSFYITIPLSTSLVKIFTVHSGDDSAAFLTSEIIEKGVPQGPIIMLNNIFKKSSEGHLTIHLEGANGFAARFTVDSLEPETKETIYTLPSRLREIFPLYGIYTNIKNKKRIPVLSARVASLLLLREKYRELVMPQHDDSDEVYLKMGRNFLTINLSTLISLESSNDLSDCMIKHPDGMTGFLLHNGLVVPVMELYDTGDDFFLLAVVMFESDVLLAFPVNDVLSSYDILDSDGSMDELDRAVFSEHVNSCLKDVKSFFKKQLARY